jgi:hypothetical protein
MRLKQGVGKIAIPLKPSQSMYARFRHIAAIPATSGDTEVPVYKLRILDNLIERLIGKKGNAEEFVKLSSKNIDTIISSLKHEIAFRNTGFKAFQTSIRPETGLILNILA